MTTLQLEIALMNYLDIRRNLIVPNVTDMSNCPIYFETDILSLSNSGFASGFELKVSKADLKGDLKKSHIRNLYKLNYKSYLNIYFKGLKYFSYCVPEDLKEDALNQIPEYFGLFVCYLNRDGIYKIKQIRKPKMLFNYIWSNEDRYELSRLGSMRILNLKDRINNLENKYISYNVLATVHYRLPKDEGTIGVLCKNGDSDKSIISKAQKIFMSRTNIVHYGEWRWYIISKELLY
jgi:hypothetical protein